MQTEKEELEKLTTIIEQHKGIIESHIFQLCDWMRRKYHLEDLLKKKAQEEICPKCKDLVASIYHNFCSNCGRKLSQEKKG